MKISKLVELCDLRVLATNESIEEEIEYAFASDLMSDVLTLDKSGVLLITGLSNLQAIRTAEMSDVMAIIIARGKEISKEMVDLAQENKIILFTSEYSVFRISGELYNAGVKALY